PKEVQEVISRAYVGHEDMGATAFMNYLNEAQEYKAELKKLGVETVTKGMVLCSVPKFRQKQTDYRKKHLENVRNSKSGKAEQSAEAAQADSGAGLRRSYDDLVELADDLETVWKEKVAESMDYTPQMKKIDEAVGKMGGAAKEYKKNRKADAAVSVIRKQIEELQMRIKEAEAEMATLDPSKDAELARSVYDDRKVLNKIYHAIDRTGMPEENKKILKYSVAACFEDHKAMSDGKDVAAAARKALECAQALIPKAVSAKKKRKANSEIMLQDNKAFVKRAITMFYDEGMDPTITSVIDFCRGIGYPIADREGIDPALEALEKDGTIQRAGYDAKGFAVYVPKGKKPHGQLTEKPLTAAEIIEADKKKNGRTPLHEDVPCEVKLNGKIITVDGAELPEDVYKRIRMAKAMDYLSLPAGEIGVDLQCYQIKALGEWAAKEMFPDAEPEDYKISMENGVLLVKRKTVRDERKIVGKRKGNRND
ncbi:MAG: hypothetical protein QXD77_00870, partial [Candidatus Aenigmatarchaeota archaeon]